MAEHSAAAEDEDAHVGHTSNPRQMNHRESSTDSPLWYAIAAGMVVVFAAVLRFRGLDTSLFEDEVWVAELVRRGGYGAHGYLTPPLFYALERAWCALGGTTASSLRVVPALFGTLVAAVPLFATTRDRITRLTWAALLACSSPLLFYSGRIKQYTLEATVACALIVLLLHAVERRSAGAWLGFFVLAALGVSTLYETAFLLGACALVSLRKPRLLVAFGLLFAFAAVAYFCWLSPGPESTRVHGDMTRFFGANGRWATSPRLFFAGTMHWVGQAMNLVRWWWLAAGLLIVTWCAARRDWMVLTLAAAPPLAIAAASALHVYPYGEVRLMIVCFPALYLVVADALALLVRRTPPALLLLVPFALHSGAYNDSYMRLTDWRPLFDDVARNRTAGEPIYADISTAAPLRFHHPELAGDVREETPPAAAAAGWHVTRGGEDASGIGIRLRAGDVTAVRLGAGGSAR
jgi:hypothetical protein